MVFFGARFFFGEVSIPNESDMVFYRLPFENEYGQDKNRSYKQVFLVLHEVELFFIYLQTTEKSLCKTQKFSYLKEEMKGFQRYCRRSVLSMFYFF